MRGTGYPALSQHPAFTQYPGLTQYPALTPIIKPAPSTHLAPGSNTNPAFTQPKIGSDQPLTLLTITHTHCRAHLPSCSLVPVAGPCSWLPLPLPWAWYRGTGVSTGECGRCTRGHQRHCTAAPGNFCHQPGIPGGMWAELNRVPPTSIPCST